MPKTKGKTNDTPANPTTNTTAFDINSYRSKATDASVDAPSEPKTERAQLPRVHWQDLDGIADLKFADVWNGTHDEFGPFQGATILLSDGKAVSVVTGEGTTAGKAIHQAMMDGKFDTLGEPDGDVPVHVRLRYATDDSGRRIPDRKPMVLLTIG